MKKIILSLSIIGVVSAIVIGATVAYFSDTEVSEGNTFTAGSIDLKIDYRCEGGSCEIGFKDLDAGDHYFSECDIKPGDSGEVTISWHVSENKAWGRLKMNNVIDYEFDCTEPESEEDSTCEYNPADPGEGLGELSEYLTFTLWMDEGSVEGWQCGYTQGGCLADLKEGNNIFDEDTYDEYLAQDISVEEFKEGIVLPEELDPENVYFVGLQWKLPSDTSNIVQSDSMVASIIAEAVQSRNNPNPWQ